MRRRRSAAARGRRASRAAASGTPASAVPAAAARAGAQLIGRRVPSRSEQAESFCIELRAPRAVAQVGEVMDGVPSCESGGRGAAVATPGRSGYS